MSVECGEEENMNQESDVTQCCTRRKERRELRKEAKKKRRKEEEDRPEVLERKGRGIPRGQETAHR